MADSQRQATIEHEQGEAHARMLGLAEKDRGFVSGCIFLQ